MAGSGRRREHLLWPLVVVAAAVAAVPVVLGRERAAATERVAREDAALATARAVAAAERRFHTTNARYGWLEDLHAAGLLTGLATAPGPHGLQVASDGYRLDVLLPSASALRGEVPLAPRDAGPAEPALAARHFAVVARPERPGEDGFRIWYLGEDGRVFLSEGVSDAEGLRENPLPLFRVTAPKDQTDPGPLFWRLADSLDAK
jgi:hypothetical protein